jgi:hypothetical protein
MDREAVFGPAEVGAKVTVTVWADAPALIVNEVGDTVNCKASVPVTAMEETVSGPVPGLETVKVFCEEAPKAVLFIAREATDRLI